MALPAGASYLGASDAKLINAVYYRSPRSLSFGIDALSKTALPPSTIGTPGL